ncbi:MAG: serine/threonine-protein kinase [Dokdonella sp.]|uniref:serine/threonine-protein kinase n=1 Tax=Dokdonella sp. TaxID=2291710 RepID=UPI0032669962
MKNELDALRILRDALDTDPCERDSYLSMRCDGDTALRDRVDALLRGIAADEVADAFAEDDVCSTAVASEDPFTGRLLGPFRLLERIGRGGMGVVYRGTREGADFAQQVAIKLIRRGFDFDDIRARFLRERRILARLSHPNLARFIDGGVADDGRPWFALEFVDGQPITTYCDTQKLGIDARVGLFLDVCAAVQHAHTQLVVHRDLKPAKILVDESANVRLLDFGIAKLVEGEEPAAHTTIGVRTALTPEYAAPEQFGGEVAGASTDIYALGVIAYEMVAGVLPIDVDRRDIAIAERSVREQPPSPLASAIVRETTFAASGDASNGGHIATPALRLENRSTTLRAFRSAVRGDLARILEKALAKEPERRYLTVDAFADDLRRWRQGAPVRVSGNRLGYRVGKFVRRNRLAVSFALLALLAVCAGLVGMAWQMRETRLQRDAADSEAQRSGAVRDYVMLLFRNAAQQKSGPTKTAREALRSGADEAVKQLESAKESGFSTILALAELYAAMDDAEGSYALLDRLLSSPRITSDAQTQARARFLMADLEFARGHVLRARELLDQSQTWWELSPTRYGRDLSESRLIQGRIERGENRADASIHTFEAGIAERRDLIGHADAETGELLVSLSISLSRAGRWREGMQRADDGYRTYVELGQEKSTSGLGALTNRGFFRRAANDLDGALTDLRLAADTRRALFGPSGELAKSDSTLAAVLISKQRYNEAVALLEPALRMALEYGGETARGAHEIRRQLAKAYLAQGHPAKALDCANSLVSSNPPPYGAQSLEAGFAYSVRAQALAALDRRDDARKDLDQAERIFKGVGAEGDRLGRDLAVLRTTLMSNEPSAAR